MSGGLQRRGPLRDPLVPYLISPLKYLDMKNRRIYQASPALKPDAQPQDNGMKFKINGPARFAVKFHIV